jgi:hypothetical protein
MLGSFKRTPEQLEAIARIEEWTRERFKLPHDAAVLVTEISCRVPGCPPLETVVAFWTQEDRRHHFKVFKPVTEVIEDDLPPGWMKNSLAGSEVFGCPCC